MSFERIQPIAVIWATIILDTEIFPPDLVRCGPWWSSRRGNNLADWKGAVAIFIALVDLHIKDTPHTNLQYFQVESTKPQWFVNGHWMIFFDTCDSVMLVKLRIQIHWFSWFLGGFCWEFKFAKRPLDDRIVEIDVWLPNGWSEGQGYKLAILQTFFTIQHF